MVPAGVVIAALAMFSGLGGGVLWVPWLIVVMGVEPREAVLCALLIQCAGQLSGTVTNWRHGTIAWRLVGQQAVVAVPTVVVGALVGRRLDAHWLEIVLGLLTFAIAYIFLRGDDLFEAGREAPDLEAGRQVRTISAIGGTLTGLVSVGVGDLLVPAFNKRCRLTMVRSVATGIALMLLLSVVAASAHLAFGGRVAPALVLPGVVGVAIGAPIGTLLQHKVSELRFKEVFVLLLVFLGSHVTFNAF
jgi:hypothetical protein